MGAKQSFVVGVLAGCGFFVLAFLRFVQTTLWDKWFATPDYFHESVPFALLFWFVLLSIGLIAGGIVWLTKTSWQELGWKRKGLLKSIGLGLLGFIALYINVVVWAMLAGNSRPPEMVAPDLGGLLFVAFFAFGLAAWVEENLYRGYLQPLLAEKMDIRIAIMVQAIIFSAAHLGYSRHLLDFGSLFVAGAILGWLRGRGASLVSPFIAHGVFWMMGAFMVITP